MTTNSRVQGLIDFVLLNEQRLPNDVSHGLMERLLGIASCRCMKCTTALVPRGCNCGAFYCKDHRPSYGLEWCNGDCNRTVCESCSLPCPACHGLHRLCTGCLSDADSKARCYVCRTPSCLRCKKYCQECNQLVCAKCAPTMHKDNCSCCDSCFQQLKEPETNAQKKAKK